MNRVVSNSTLVDSMGMDKKESRKQRTTYSSILFTSFTNILILLITTITSIITSRMFGAEGKGELAAILFWPGFLANLATLGLPTAIIYYTKKNGTLSQAYNGIGLMIQIPNGILVGIIGWIGVSTWLAKYSDSVVSIAKLYTAFLSPLLLIIGVFAATAQGTEKFHIFNLARISAPFINFLGLIVLWLSGTLTLEHAIIVSYISYISVMFVYVYSLRMHISIKPLEIIDKIRSSIQMFKYSLRVLGVELLNTLYNQFDKIVILLLLTPRDFGLYSVVYALSRMFNVFQNAVTNVIFPKATGLEQDQVFTLVGRAFRINMMLMFIIIVPSIVVGRYLLGLLYGHDFLEASVAFYLLAFECVLSGGAGILVSSFNALGRPGISLVGQITGLSTTILLFFILTPQFGLNGVGTALLAGSVVRIIVSLILLKKIYKASILKLLYDRSDFQFVKGHLMNRLLLKKGAN